MKILGLAKKPKQTILTFKTAWREPRAETAGNIKKNSVRSDFQIKALILRTMDA